MKRQKRVSFCPVSENVKPVTTYRENGIKAITIKRIINTSGERVSPEKRARNIANNERNKLRRANKRIDANPVKSCQAGKARKGLQPHRSQTDRFLANASIVIVRPGQPVSVAQIIKDQIIEKRAARTPAPNTRRYSRRRDGTIKFSLK